MPLQKGIDGAGLTVGGNALQMVPYHRCCSEHFPEHQCRVFPGHHLHPPVARATLLTGAGFVRQLVAILRYQPHLIGPHGRKVFALEFFDLSAITQSIPPDNHFSGFKYAIQFLITTPCSVRRIAHTLGVKRRTVPRYAAVSKCTTEVIAGPEPWDPSKGTPPSEVITGSRHLCGSFREVSVPMLELGFSAQRIYQDFPRQEAPCA